MHSTDLTQDNIARIRELFPGCVTEAKAEDGYVKLAVDFDQLRQELSGSVVEGPQERYHLNWPGKREALLTANTPIAKTLRPCREESLDFDTTKNLFIEGDNLDALKLLQENYLGKIKMIYIDPPYNTGNDFIYADNFSEGVESFLLRSSQKDEQGNRLVANTVANGRFHSDWLSMIFPRLKLARNLLSEEGIIFISIDENEVSNLKALCDEVFGSDNCKGIVSRPTGTPSGQGYNILVNEIDYILVYSKSSSGKLLGTPFSGQDEKIYDQQDNFGKYLTRTLRKTGGEDRREDRPTMYYGVEAPDGSLVFPMGPTGYESRWRCGEDTYKDLLKQNRIEWKKGADGWKPYQKFYLEGRLKQPSNLWQGLEGNKKASLTIKDLFNGKVFDTPKPVGLIEHCLKISTHQDDLVLDFFAGSSTTAHAVLSLNAQDGGHRRFIMVQLPEKCDESSEAYKAGYMNISDIGKDRIRKAGKQFSQGVLSEDQSIDIGFRVLKVGASNMAAVFYAPDDFDKGQIDFLVDNIKSDRSAEDLLFQVMLDWGIDLALPIAKKTIYGKEVLFVDGDVLVACFDAHGGIDEGFVKELAKHQPLRVVFRDAGFRDSAVKINVEQIFKSLSPSTEVKCI